MPQRRWRVDVCAVVYGVTLMFQRGVGGEKEEGRQMRPSLAARAVHVPPLHTGSDGSGQVLSIVYILR